MKKVSLIALAVSAVCAFSYASSPKDPNTFHANSTYMEFKGAQTDTVPGKKKKGTKQVTPATTSPASPTTTPVNPANPNPASPNTNPVNPANQQRQQLHQIQQRLTR
jgi:hypothetical protein